MSQPVQFLRAVSLALSVALLGGCASQELTQRLAAAERDIRTLDRNDAAFQKAIEDAMTTNRRYADELRRIEGLLSRQTQSGAELERAAREALSIARESAAVTRRLDIRQLGDTPILIVK